MSRLICCSFKSLNISFLFSSSLQPVVPKKPKRSVPVSSSVDRDHSHREAGRISAVTPLSREASDVMPTPTVRKTDVRTETQPNGSEVTTTIVEFTDQVNYIIPVRNVLDETEYLVQKQLDRVLKGHLIGFVCFRITVYLAWVKFLTLRDRASPLWVQTEGPVQF